jgi:hypothetical protein
MEAEVSEIRIDADKAERIIAQTLLDVRGMGPAEAAATAERICRRLIYAMPTSTRLDRYRIIPREPPDSAGFANAVAKKLFEGKVSSEEAADIWELVYNRGRHLRMN